MCSHPFRMWVKGKPRVVLSPLCVSTLLWPTMLARKEVTNLTSLNNNMAVSFQRKRLQLKNYDILKLLVKKFTVHNLSAPHKRGILKLYIIMLMWYPVPRNATKELCNIMKVNNPVVLRVINRTIRRTAHIHIDS